jgi:hypothetical protein
MKYILIQNSIVIDIWDIYYPIPPVIDPFDESILVVTSDNPNIEIGWLYIDGEFIQN